MGAILVQQSPLCIADLEGLLDLRNLKNYKPVDIEHFVRRLRTVLVAGAGEITRRTFPRVHRSFTDFITSAGAKDFRVDPIDSDGELSIQCIHQLNQLRKYYANSAEVDMPSQLPYAISRRDRIFILSPILLPCVTGPQQNPILSAIFAKSQFLIQRIYANYINK
jgi:hypothetical protein